VGLVIPAVFSNALANDPAAGDVTEKTLRISRATAIILLFSYLVYIFFQMKTHDGLYAEIYEADELKDADLAKAKLTLTECIVALVIALTVVSMIAVFLVQQIHFMVSERHISDAFVGLILLPLVEKAAGMWRAGRLVS
jgi:Ca2+:H+ antiporter